jgi:hypothetical protein
MDNFCITSPHFLIICAISCIWRYVLKKIEYNERVSEEKLYADAFQPQEKRLATNFPLTRVQDSIAASRTPSQASGRGRMKRNRSRTGVQGARKGIDSRGTPYGGCTVRNGQTTDFRLQISGDSSRQETCAHAMPSHPEIELLALIATPVVGGKELQVIIHRRRRRGQEASSSGPALIFYEAAGRPCTVIPYTHSNLGSQIHFLFTHPAHRSPHNTKSSIGISRSI